ncbi:MAG: hypothetical protein V3W18_10865, partial [candidate division Zixibacteria bacterium]
VVACPLCGYNFERTGQNICAECPINPNCDKICCPNCRYGWIASSSVVDFFTRIFKKGKKRIGRS